LKLDDIKKIIQDVKQLKRSKESAVESCSDSEDVNTPSVSKPDKSILKKSSLLKSSKKLKDGKKKVKFDDSHDTADKDDDDDGDEESGEESDDADNEEKIDADSNDEESEDESEEIGDEDEDDNNNDEGSKSEGLAESSDMVLKEDIYGRLRDKAGNVVTATTGSYVPPGKRLEAAGMDEKKKWQLDRLNKQVKGLVNR
jgi:hypothetical protein